MEVDNISPDPAEVPSLDEVKARVASLSSVLQFKNSLKFVNTSTNMTLDRMISALDHVGADCYLDGFKAGLLVAKATIDKREVK